MAAAAEIRQGKSAVSLSTRPAEQSTPRILLIEDSLEAQMLVRRFLSTRYHLDAYPTSRGALTAASEKAYDLFIVDINLGYNDTGVHALNALRRHARYAEAPIVALTAYALPGDRERFLEMGFDAYVSKPFSKEDLLAPLRRLLSPFEQRVRH